LLSPTAFLFDRQRIVVTDEDSVTTASIIATLRRDGHSVTHDPTALSAPDWLVLPSCHLMIGSMRVDGVVRMDLLQELWDRLPTLAVLRFLEGAAHILDPQQVDRLGVLRVPFTTSELRIEVGRLLPQLRTGTVLARTSGETALGALKLTSPA
jgi:DNA-binding NtrC family response regulator